MLVVIVAQALTLLLIVALHQTYSWWRKSRALDHIPTHEFPDGDNSQARYLNDLQSLLETGYRKYNKSGQAFKVKIPIGGYAVKYRVILPKDHLEEIKHLPNNVFSWQLASRIVFAQDYTGAPDRGAWSGKALRVGIHQNLAAITTQLDTQIQEYFKVNLPQDADSFIRLNMMEFFVPAIANVTNALLVHQYLSSNPEWVRETCNFAVNRYGAADEVRSWPPYLAKFVSPLLPTVRKLGKSRAFVLQQMKFLYDELKERERLNPAGKEKNRKGVFGYEWLWDGAPDDVSLQDFSDTMMRTLIASIHTTAKTLSIAFVDLLTQPEYVQELREEVQQHSGHGGAGMDVDKLTKLDCFLKESQRLTPVFLLTMNRLVTQDYSFKKSGLRLPQGTLTSAATAAIATDPDTFSGPNNFDGNRFRRLREEHKEGESSFKMGMATNDSLGFGLGNQACPARFFAVNQMKLIIGKMLLGYDIALEKGGKTYIGARPTIGYNDFSVEAPTEFGLKLKKLSK